MKRSECLKLLFDKMAQDVIVVGNVGDTATVMLTYRPSDANVYSVNLGSCSAMGLGLALGLPQRRVVVLDGDGNLLLNLAVLADIAREAPKNLAIIVQDNEVYGAAGNMPSATAGPADLADLAKSAGIKRTGTIRDLERFQKFRRRYSQCSRAASVCRQNRNGDRPAAKPRDLQSGGK